MLCLHWSLFITLFLSYSISAALFSHCSTKKDTVYPYNVPCDLSMREQAGDRNKIKKSKKKHNKIVPAFSIIDGPHGTYLICDINNYQPSCCVTINLFISFCTLFWYVILGWYHDNLGWKIVYFFKWEKKLFWTSVCRFKSQLDGYDMKDS